MRALSLLFLACVSCSPVPALGIELVDGKPMLTMQEFEQLKICQSAGGCYIVTLKALEAMVDKTIEVTLIESAKRGCRRNSI